MDELLLLLLMSFLYLQLLLLLLLLFYVLERGQGSFADNLHNLLLKLSATGSSYCLTPRLCAAPVGIHASAVAGDRENGKFDLFVVYDPLNDHIVHA